MTTLTTTRASTQAPFIHLSTKEEHSQWERAKAFTLVTEGIKSLNNPLTLRATRDRNKIIRIMKKLKTRLVKMTIITTIIPLKIKERAWANKFKTLEIIAQSLLIKAKRIRNALSILTTFK